MTRLVQEALAKSLYYHQGGPIILSQIENEYGNVESGIDDYLVKTLELIRRI